jgi:hypothetical protein
LRASLPISVKVSLRSLLAGKTGTLLALDLLKKLGDYTGTPLQKSPEVKILTINDFFRLPRITDSFNIEWVYSLSLCKFLKTLGGANTTLPQILDILLQRLAQMPSADQRTITDRQVILACQAFAASTIFAKTNLQNLRVGLWNPLNFYHPSGLDYGDFLQMSLMLVSEPHKKLDQPLNLFQGFDPQLCNEWHTPIAVLHTGQHPLQIWLKKKHQLCLIGYIREQKGSEDFRRTNYGLLKRTSAIKLGEALTKFGLLQVTSLLILQRVLQDAVARKQFNTANPQTADYQRLHLAYQEYLISKNAAVCSLFETIDRLELLGNCLRNYKNSRVQSLNAITIENGDELLDRLSSDHYIDPLNAAIDREHQTASDKLKTYIHQQLVSLRPIQLELLCLNVLGYNDSQISLLHKVSASTVKRRRVRILQKNFLGVNFYSLVNSDAKRSSGSSMVADQINQKAIEAAYLEVIHDYFVTEITRISREVISLSSASIKIMPEVVKNMNHYWQINLLLNHRLECALENLLQKEGVA